MTQKFIVFFLGFKCLESVSNAHEDAVNALAISSDGVVYTGSAGKGIKIWKKKKKACGLLSKLTILRGPSLQILVIPKNPTQTGYW